MCLTCVAGQIFHPIRNIKFRKIALLRANRENKQNRFTKVDVTGILTDSMLIIDKADLRQPGWKYKDEKSCKLMYASYIYKWTQIKIYMNK